MAADSEITDRRGDEINLLDYLLVILKRKNLIFGFTVASALLGTALAFLIPPKYKAETRILPPQTGASVYSEVLSQFGGGVAGLAGSALGFQNPNDVYIGMLKSRTIYDRIIDRFALMALYDEKYRKDAMEKLDESVDVKSGNDEILVVSVVDKDPQRASDMANAFIDELKALTHTLAVTEASKRRLFLEELLRQTKQDLTAAEDSMRRFQEKTGVVKMEEQAESVIGSITELRAQVAAKEVELKVMRTYTTPRNPDLQMAEEQLRGMKEQIAKLEAKSGSAQDSLVPAGRIPAIGTDYMRNLRDMKYYETLYELIAKQYEMARMDEARDATIIQVLDRAVPPDKEASPQKALIVAIAAFSGLFISIFAAFFMEFAESISSDSESQKKIQIIKKYMRLRKNP